jgi:sortase A
MHRHLNNYLTIAVVGLGLYLIVSPLIPAMQFWWRKSHGFNQPEYVTSVLNGYTNNSVSMPEDNRIAIPSIGLDVGINEGSGLAAADTAAWRRPGSSTPPAGGNTVIVGHRYSYAINIARPFYNLDKVTYDDEIIVFWQKHAYRYKVTQIMVVTPNQVGIETPSNDSRLTLYTCTPLWTAQNRLVVVAELQKEQP